MQIDNYEVAINEKNASFCLIVDTNEYNINFLKVENLFYTVDHKTRKIKVYSKNLLINSITFNNADNELLYYALKSPSLQLLAGTTEPLKIEFTLTAELE